MKNVIVVIAIFIVWCQAVVAQEPAIIKGYGKTKWGQSRQEVSQLVDGLVTDKEDGPNLVSTGDGVIEKVVYGFYFDRLVTIKVRISFPDGVEYGPNGSDALRIVGEIIQKKYYENAESRDALIAAGIIITVAGSGSDKMHTATVTYSNNKLYEELRRQSEELRKADIRRAIEQMHLEDRL